METERCKRIVATIQNLEPTETMELFKLLHKHKCEYTRNNNGIFINLSWLSDEILDKIEQYIAFCNKSHNEVQRYESICDVLNKNFQEQTKTADNKDELHPTMMISLSDKKTNATASQGGAPSKVSSSMRFYLLKKRFAKQVPLTTNAKTDLNVEVYPM